LKTIPGREEIMEKLRIAALVGDFYHAPEPMIRALEASIDGKAYALEAYVDPRKLPWDSLGGYAALVVAREGRVAPDTSDEVWNTERHERAIADFTASGGALVALHAGLASYDLAGLYGRTIRGTFLFHPKEHPRFTVRSSGVNHPVLADFRELALRDEMYFVRIDSSDTRRLLEAASPDYGSSAAAWAHTLGSGRVFCLTPGHNPEVLSDPGYRNLLKSGIGWALAKGSSSGSGE
jgi:type 1 glutamine amidotransferase